MRYRDAAKRNKQDRYFRDGLRDVAWLLAIGCSIALDTLAARIGEAIGKLG